MEKNDWFMMKHCIFELVNIGILKAYTVYDDDCYEVNFKIIVHENKRKEISNHSILFPIQTFKENPKYNINSLFDKEEIVTSYEFLNHREFKNEIYEFVIYCYKFLWKRKTGL